MAGRLQMTAENIVRAYREMGPEIFSERNKMTFKGTRGPRFKDGPMAEAMQKLVRKYDTRANKDALLYDPQRRSLPRAKT